MLIYITYTSICNCLFIHDFVFIFIYIYVCMYPEYVCVFKDYLMINICMHLGQFIYNHEVKKKVIWLVCMICRP